MDELHIRVDSFSTFALYRGDQVLARGLTSRDATEFCQMYASIPDEKFGTDAEYDRPTHSKSAEIHGPATIVRTRGRKLVLQDHVDTIRSMVDEDPATTTRDVERRLRRSGVKFANATAITNVAKSFNIRLRA